MVKVMPTTKTQPDIILSQEIYNLLNSVTGTYATNKTLDLRINLNKYSADFRAL